MRRLAAVSATACALLAALTTGAGAAQAAARGAGPVAGPAAGFASSTPMVSFHLLGGLHLKRVDTMNGNTQTTYLLCTSTASGNAAPVIHGLGGLKDATSACEELAAVHGDLDALAVHPSWLPPSIVAPVDVQVAGTWEGAKVAWSHEYPNSGWLAKATGDVFEF